VGDPCIDLSRIKETVSSEAVVTTKRISEVLEDVKTHWLRTHAYPCWCVSLTWPSGCSK
jgi:hypothetical protein